MKREPSGRLDYGHQIYYKENNIQKLFENLEIDKIVSYLTAVYIYFVIHRQICFVLSELISVARQYLPVAGIETRLTQMPCQRF